MSQDMVIPFQFWCGDVLHINTVADLLLGTHLIPTSAHLLNVTYPLKLDFRSQRVKDCLSLSGGALIQQLAVQLDDLHHQVLRTAKQRATGLRGFREA